MTTIVIAEDHHIVRDGLKALLAAEETFSLVGEAADGLKAIDLVEQHRPDILLLDLMIPRLHGLEVAARVRREFKTTKVVILSMHADEPYVVEALRNGASGYVVKDSMTNLVEAIKAVAAGQRYLSPEVADKAKSADVKVGKNDQLDVFEALTKRERHVLQLAAEGLTSAQIAEKLFISPRTAETHRANLMRKLSLRSQTDLMRKLSLRSQTDLVRYAIRKKIIEA